MSVTRFRGDTYPFAPAYVRYTSAAMATSPRAHAHQGIGNPNVMLLYLQYPLTPLPPLPLDFRGAGVNGGLGVNS